MHDRFRELALQRYGCSCPSCRTQTAIDERKEKQKMQIVDFYTTSQDDLKLGDVLVATITLHVSYRLDKDGRPMYRMYRCGYPPQQISEDGIPQGGRIFMGEKGAEAIFSIVAGLSPD